MGLASALPTGGEGGEKAKAQFKVKGQHGIPSDGRIPVGREIAQRDGNSTGPRHGCGAAFSPPSEVAVSFAGVFFFFCFLFPRLFPLFFLSLFLSFRSVRLERTE